MKLQVIFGQLKEMQAGILTIYLIKAKNWIFFSVFDLIIEERSKSANEKIVFGQGFF